MFALLSAPFPAATAGGVLDEATYPHTILEGASLDINVTVHNSGPSSWQAWRIQIDAMSWDPWISTLRNDYTTVIPADSQTWQTRTMVAAALPVAPGDYTMRLSTYYRTTGSTFYEMAGSPVLISFTIQAAVAPTVTLHPTDQVVCAGCTATFVAGASGSPAPTVQWQMSVNGGLDFADVPGATGTTLTLTAQAADDGNLYRARFTNARGSATSDAATLEINPLEVAVDAFDPDADGSVRATAIQPDEAKLPSVG